MVFKSYNFILNKIKRLLKFFFIIFVIIFVIFNVFIINIYNNVLETVTSNDNVQYSPLIRKLPKTKEIFENISQIQPNDFNTLLNITDFTFSINNPYKCEKNEIFMLVFIHSATQNFEKRRILRQTWANEKLYWNTHNKVRFVFMVGLSNNSDNMKRIHYENQTYGDIIQGNFVDSYRNITYKHVMGLKWTTYFCQNAKYVFKVDDDIFVDLNQLIYYLKGSIGDSPKNLIACYLRKNYIVHKSYRNKWRVTHKEYPNKYYPPYCAGWGIIMSTDVVFDLYRISRSRPFFWIDDVFISGILANDLKINFTDLNLRISIDDYKIENWLKNDELTIPPMFGLPNSNTKQISQLWNKTVEYYRIKLNHN